MMQAVLQPALGDRLARTCRVSGLDSSFANETKQVRHPDAGSRAFDLLSLCKGVC